MSDRKSMMWKIDDNDMPAVRSALEFGNPFRDEVGRFAPKGGGGGGGAGGGVASPEIVDAGARMDIRADVTRTISDELEDEDALLGNGGQYLDYGTRMALVDAANELDASLIGGRKNEINDGLVKVKATAENALSELDDYADSMDFDVREDMSIYGTIESVVNTVDGYLMSPGIGPNL